MHHDRLDEDYRPRSFSIAVGAATSRRSAILAVVAIDGSAPPVQQLDAAAPAAHFARLPHLTPINDSTFLCQIRYFYFFIPNSSHPDAAFPDELHLR